MHLADVFVYATANVGGSRLSGISVTHTATGMGGSVRECSKPEGSQSARGERWFAFAYQRATVATSALVGIREQSDRDWQARDSDPTLLALVGADAIANWWSSAEAVPPLHGGTFFATSRVVALLSRVAWCPDPTAGERMRNEAQACALVCETMDAWRAGDLIERTSDAVIDEAERRRITHARALIEERYAEKLTIEDLARACGMGRGRLIRGFKMLYGRTVACVLAERRLVGAARALQTTSLPVSRIAADNGYCSNAAFTRAFSRRYGQVPSHFRTASA